MTVMTKRPILHTGHASTIGRNPQMLQKINALESVPALRTIFKKTMKEIRNCEWGVWDTTKHEDHTDYADHFDYSDYVERSPYHDSEDNPIRR